MRLSWVIVLALVLGGCAEQSIEETQALVIAETEACQMAATDMVRINRYQAYLFAFTGADDTSTQPPCVNCIVTGRCPLLERTCGCTEPHLPLTGPINRHLSGLGFTDVEPDRPYCLALMGMDDPAAPVGPGERPTTCDCLPATDAPTTACGLSPFPGFVEENSNVIFVSMECTRLQCGGLANILADLESMP
jgi:hypothetical protein